MKLPHAFAVPSTALLVTAALALVGLRQEPVESPADELKEADRAFSRETTERGLAGWLAWFAADVLILEPGGEPARGVEGVRGYYESVPGFPPSGFRWEPDSAGLATSGELGWTAGTFSTAQVKDAGRYLSIWILEDGDWKVLTDLGGDSTFRTRLERLDGPPASTSSQAVETWVSEDGALAVSTGTWEAKRGERTTAGRFLAVWERDEKGVWSVVVESGGADS